jgi:cyanate permease
LPEQPRITYLQEKIKEARNNARKAGITAYLGVAMALFGFTLYFYPDSAFANWTTLMVGILGVIMFALSEIGKSLENSNKDKLMRELDNLSRN